MLRSRLLSLALAGAVGALAGLSASLFLFLLQLVTLVHQQNTWLLFLLPLMGLVIGSAHHKWEKNKPAGMKRIFLAAFKPHTLIPLFTGPLLLTTTLLTHLFGGSSGREGTAVQMGAAGADLLLRKFPLPRLAKRKLIVAGISAGFAAALGTPLAGALFGMEVLRKKMVFSAWRECVTASFAAIAITHLVHAPHSSFPAPNLPSLSVGIVVSVALLGVLLGLFGFCFVWCLHKMQTLSHFIAWPPLRPALGGVALVIFTLALGTHRYSGLGIEQIQQFLQGESPLPAPFFKALATVLTVGAGLKGGEFIPLVYMGTSLSVILAPLLQAPPAFLAALGFGALFGSVSKTPLACSLLVSELFGWQFFPPALVCCWMAAAVSGELGIYPRRAKPRKWRFSRTTK